MGAQIGLNLHSLNTACTRRKGAFLTYIYDKDQDVTMTYPLCLRNTLYILLALLNCIYNKCPKISYTLVSDKIAYANSAGPDQTAPKGAV